MNKEKIPCRLCGNVIIKGEENKHILNCCKRVIDWHKKIKKHVEPEKELSEVV